MSLRGFLGCYFVVALIVLPMICFITNRMTVTPNFTVGYDEKGKTDFVSGKKIATKRYKFQEMCKRASG